jgi:hypothetical protein
LSIACGKIEFSEDPYFGAERLPSEVQYNLDFQEVTGVAHGSDPALGQIIDAC